MTAPTEWTVRLREGVRYSDGTPVEIEDVATALKMYRDRSTAPSWPAFFPEWPTVVRVDDRTFRMETKNPIPILDYLMTNILITPAEGNKPEELQSGVGTGPYVVTKPTAAPAPTRLDRNENYWGPGATRAASRSGSFPRSPAASSPCAAARWTSSTPSPPTAIEQLAGLPGVALETASRHPAEPALLQLPQARRATRWPTPRVREALSCAINGEALVKDVLRGLGRRRPRASSRPA